MEKIKITINFILESGACSNNPNLNTTLGQNGINIKKFMTDFNKYSLSLYKPGLKLRVKVNVFNNRTFNFKILGIPSSIFLKKCFLNNTFSKKCLNFYKSTFLMNISDFYSNKSIKTKLYTLKGTLNSFNI